VKVPARADVGEAFAALSIFVKKVDFVNGIDF